MPVVISVMRFRDVETAGEYQDAVVDEGFEPQIRRIDSDFAVVTAVSAEDDFEVSEAQKILTGIKYRNRDPQVRVLSDEEIAQSRKVREDPRAPTITPPKVRGARITEVTPEKRAYLRQYRQSDAFKQSQQRYQQSSAGREAQRRYAQSEVGKEKRKAYQESEKGKLAREAFQERQKEKRQLLKAQKEGTLTEEQMERFRDVFGEEP